MDDNLKALCLEISKQIRKKYHPNATITIDGNYGYQVIFNGSLLPDNQVFVRRSDGSIAKSGAIRDTSEL